MKLLVVIGNSIGTRSTERSIGIKRAGNIRSPIDIPIVGFYNEQLWVYDRYSCILKQKKP